MNLLRIFRAPPPSIEDSARHMAEYSRMKDRERFKLKARLMRQDMGLPPLEALGG